MYLTTAFPIGASTRVLSGHTAAVNSIDLSADGQTAVTGSDDTLVRLWSIASGTEAVWLASFWAWWANTRLSIPTFMRHQISNGLPEWINFGEVQALKC